MDVVNLTSHRSQVLWQVVWVPQGACVNMTVTGLVLPFNDGICNVFKRSRKPISTFFGIKCCICTVVFQVQCYMYSCNFHVTEQ
jgi:hypothetical protein